MGRRASFDTSRLALFVHETAELNAAAGAARLLFVTEGALRRTDSELEALLAHELGHHRGLHPIATTIVWWLALPGELLAHIFAALRRLGGRLSPRLPALTPILAVVLVIWQLCVMWLYYVGKVLMQRTARVSEFVADGAAVQWGYGAELLALYRTLPDDARCGPYGPPGTTSIGSSAF